MNYVRYEFELDESFRLKIEKADPLILNNRQASLACFFRCTQARCNFCSSTDKRFVKHLVNQHSSEELCCCYCQQIDNHNSSDQQQPTLYTADALVQHLLSAHGKRNLQCSLCEFRACTTTHLEIHALTTHPEAGDSMFIIECATPDNNGDFDIHAQEQQQYATVLFEDFNNNADVYKDFVCQYCRYTSDNQGELLRHQTERHSDFSIFILTRENLENNADAESDSESAVSTATVKTDNSDAQAAMGSPNITEDTGNAAHIKQESDISLSNQKSEVNSATSNGAPPTPQQTKPSDMLNGMGLFLENVQKRALPSSPITALSPADFPPKRVRSSPLEKFYSEYASNTPTSAAKYSKTKSTLSHSLQSNTTSYAGTPTNTKRSEQTNKSAQQRLREGVWDQFKLGSAPTRDKLKTGKPKINEFAKVAAHDVVMIQPGPTSRLSKRLNAGQQQLIKNTMQSSGQTALTVEMFCAFCEYKCTARTTLTAHMLAHIYNYNCDLCNFSTGVLEQLERHRSLAHDAPASIEEISTLDKGIIRHWAEEFIKAQHSKTAGNSTSKSLAARSQQSEDNETGVTCTLCLKSAIICGEKPSKFSKAQKLQKHFYAHSKLELLTKETNKRKNCRRVVDYFHQELNSLCKELSR